jgi:hypothetical protein
VLKKTKVLMLIGAFVLIIVSLFAFNTRLAGLIGHVLPIDVPW